MRGSPSAWPTMSSALRRGDSIPFEAKNSEVFLTTSRTFSMGGCCGREPAGASAQLGGRLHQLIGAALQGCQALVVVRLLEAVDKGADRALHDLGKPVERKADP